MLNLASLIIGMVALVLAVVAFLPLLDRKDLPFYTVVTPGCDQPPEEPAPHQALTSLSTTLDALVAENALPPGAGVLLQGELTVIGSMWRNGYLSATLAGADRFEADVGRLVGTGRLADDLGVKLVDGRGQALAFGGLMWLAALNKRRYGPAIASGDQAAVAGFKRTVAIEWCVLAAILIATALLTALFAPEHLEGSFGHAIDPEHPSSGVPSP